MKNVLMLVFLVAAYSCATSTEVMLPSGQSGYSITCHENKTGCYEKAQEVCPKGYEMIDTSAATNGSMINNNVTLSSQHTMLIDCKK